MAKPTKEEVAAICGARPPRSSTSVDLYKEIFAKDQCYELAMIGGEFGMHGDQPVLFIQALQKAYFSEVKNDA